MDYNKVQYINWLYELVGGDDGACRDYILLMQVLAERDFYWTIDRDSNRAEDGKNLRNRFKEECGGSDIYGPCSVLEMMVALACRIDDDIMYDNRFGNRSDQWMYMMIDNLGLSDCTNQNWNGECLEKVHHTVDILLDRRYADNGSGGSLFPIKSKKVYQKGNEIWLQMTAFLNENLNN